METLSIKLSPNMRIDISGDKSQDIIRTAAFWQSIPTTCPVCNAGLVFDYQTPKTYKYYKLKCTGPTPHTSNLSERMEGGGMYYDNRKEWQVWRVGVSEADGLELGRTDAMQTPQNAPGTERGDMIAEILRLVKLRQDEGKQVNLKLDDLGTRQTEGLAAMIRYLEGL